MAKDEWQYEPAKDINQSLEESLRDFPREPVMWVYAIRSFAAGCLRLWLRLFHGFDVKGRENLPLEKSFVLIANHTSHWDALSLLSVLPLNKLHRAFPAAAADYFFTSLPRVAISAVFVNALPFQRRIKIQHSMELCRRLLSNPRNVLIIFPEGTRSGTGEINDFKPGIGCLLAGTEIPVIPCYIKGAYASWPRQKVLPRLKPLEVIIGKPRTFSEFNTEKASVHRIAEELRKAVLDLGEISHD